jgi:(R,R)-butanediol dehydrogenase / meso-butanediol dehydrogenase / diacetyl reductase
MRAVRLHGVKDLRFEQVPAPAAPEAGWVLIDVEAAGICGSDLHNFSTGQWISRSPTTAGHEVCGRVAAVGEGVSFVPGDSVVADSRYWCGTCANCLAGDHNSCASLGFIGEVCDGGFAEQILLPERLIHLRPATLDPRAAAMAEPMAVALHAIARLALKPAEPVLIVGCGTIGGLCALALSQTHGGPILVSDRNAARVETVAQAASGQGVDLDSDAIAAATGGRPVRHVIDATGSIAALRQILDIIGSNATLALVGISHGTLDLDPNRLVEREINLVGCHAFRDELPAAIAMCATLEDTLISLIDATIELEEVPAAFNRLLAGQMTGLKTIIAIAPDAAG